MWGSTQKHELPCSLSRLQLLSRLMVVSSDCWKLELVAHWGCSLGWFNQKHGRVFWIIKLFKMRNKLSGYMPNTLFYEKENLALRTRGLWGGTWETSHTSDILGTAVTQRSQHGWDKRVSGMEQVCCPLHLLLLPHNFWARCRPCVLLLIQIIYITSIIVLLLL